MIIVCSLLELGFFKGEMLHPALSELLAWK